MPGASRSGFDARRSRGPSAADVRRAELTPRVATVHAEVKGRYARPRTRAALAAPGVACGVDLVARVMREAGIAAKTKRTFRQATDSNHSRPVAETVRDREFDPAEPNTSWVADVTYVPAPGGWVYLAAVEDLFSRRVVGGSMDATMTSRVVVGALEMASAARLQGRSGAAPVSHSDRGGPSASEHDRRRPAEERITCRTSRRGDCWGNAPMESFPASRKKERVHGADDATRAEAEASIFEYIEAFYDRVRRHSSLGSVAPDECERTRNQTHR